MSASLIGRSSPCPVSGARSIQADPGRTFWVSVVMAILIQCALAAWLATNPRFYGSTRLENVLDDVQLYQHYAGRMLSGDLPYRDFRVEYPPLALPFFVLPQALAGHSFTTFWFAFGVEMLLMHAASLALAALWIQRREGSRATLRRMVWATVIFLPLAQLSVTRFDLAPAFMMFAASMAWACGRPRLSGLLAGLGVLVKIVPGVILGPIAAEETTRWRKTRLQGTRTGLVATVVGVSAWVVAVGGPGSMRESLRYHVDRGLEVGSLWAGGLMAVGKMLRWPMETEYRFKSAQILAPGDAILSSVAFPVQAIAILGVMFAFVRWGRSEPLRFAAASVLAFILFGKVLSPQYLLWVYPFVLVIEGRIGWASRLLFLGAAGLTLLLYPWGFHRLVVLDRSAILILNLRNGLLLGLWILWVFGPVRRLRDPLDPEPVSR